MAPAGMVPCRCLMQTDLASSGIFCISTTTIRPAAQSQLNGNDQGSTGAWCCCCKRAYHQRQCSDLRSYDALFITVEACLGRCCGAETALLAWWLIIWRYEDDRMPSRFGRREFGTRALSVFFSFHLLLYCLVAREEDNKK